MPTKKISVQKDPDSQNVLEIRKDGLFVPKQVVYAGICNEQGLGLKPAAWQQASHVPGNPDGYVLFPSPDLVEEHYSVVCTPRIEASEKLNDVHHKPMPRKPVTFFVHDLGKDHFHIYVVDKEGNPVEHPFTWMLIVPE